MRRHAAFNLGLLAGVLASSLLLAEAAHADIWKWVDVQGQPHYSDRWTPGAVLIKGEHLHASDLSGPTDDQTPPDASSRQITDELNREEAQRAVKKDEAAARAKQCKAAKDHYEQVIQARRIYREDKNGERTYLSDEQADKERLQARLDMQNACGSNAS